MHIAGASWIYALCILFTSWRDWCCLYLLPTQLWRDPHIQAQVSLRSHLLETPSCISAEIPLISYGLLHCWKMSLCITISLIEMKGLLHLPLSLSAEHSHYNHVIRAHQERVRSSKHVLWLPCRWHVSKEVEIQSSTAWCVQAAESGEIKEEVVPMHGHLQHLLGEQPRLLLLSKYAFDSMGITPWQCQQSR